MSTTLAVLRAARELVARPGGWTQNTAARDRYGRAVTYADPTACSFCLIGAILRADYDQKAKALIEVRDAVEVTLNGRSLISWNDYLATGQAGVIDVLDRTIARLENAP